MRYLIIITFVAAFLAACNSATDQSADKKRALDNVMDQIGLMNKNVVRVLKAENAGSYTYVKLDENGRIFWAAITARPVQTGKLYIYSDAMMMKDFESRQLGRTFDSVMFIQNFTAYENVEENLKPQSDPHAHTQTPKYENISVGPAKGGHTIADIYNNMESLNNSPVTVKGEVVKISENIMKRNWIHIQDGTRSGGNYDLTITTFDPVGFKVGDVITFQGNLSVNKDFGAGYKYTVIVEDATWHKPESF
jgi:hypothetical protein